MNHRYEDTNILNKKLMFLTNATPEDYKHYLNKLDRGNAQKELYKITLYESIISYKYLVFKSWITMNILENINEKNAPFKFVSAARYIKHWIDRLNYFKDLSNLKDKSFIEPFCIDVLTVDSMCNDAVLSKKDIINECIRIYTKLGIHNDKDKVNSECLYESFKLCLTHSYIYTVNTLYNVFDKHFDKNVELLKYPELILGRKIKDKWVINSVINRYKSQIHFFFESYNG